MVSIHGAFAEFFNIAKPKNSYLFLAFKFWNSHYFVEHLAFTRSHGFDINSNETMKIANISDYRYSIISVKCQILMLCDWKSGNSEKEKFYFVV